ncbi:hypothetical protein AVEN_129357-1 [Araneus ventricosus]|uniref:Uncharacterized protein n=1 Tax=Araneus ventricosus TaxID=182803 RepID=A0A4Y2QSC7_ARAVE|nr:hypothetical protein AVEN_129357-1 [Araneus ventricosus]
MNPFGQFFMEHFMYDQVQKGWNSGGALRSSLLLLPHFSALGGTSCDFSIGRNIFKSFVGVAVVLQVVEAVSDSCILQVVKYPFDAQEDPQDMLLFFHEFILSRRSRI